MNENAKKWLAALRSGEFRQTQKVLHNAEGYCCLGVACELYRREHPDCHWGDPAGHRKNAFAILGEFSMLPLAVQDWLGLQNVLGNFVVNGTTICADHPTEQEAWWEEQNLDDSLAALNDDCGSTFPEIADVIEKYEANLFVSNS